MIERFGRGHVREPSVNGRTDRDAVWRAHSCGPKEQCIKLGQDRTNPFAAPRGDKSAMWPFAKILLPLIFVRLQTAAVARH